MGDEGTMDEPRRKQIEPGSWLADVADRHSRQNGGDGQPDRAEAGSAYHSNDHGSASPPTIFYVEGNQHWHQGRHRQNPDMGSVSGHSDHAVDDHGSMASYWAMVAAPVGLWIAAGCWGLCDFVWDRPYWSAMTSSGAVLCLGQVMGWWAI